MAPYHLSRVGLSVIAALSYAHSTLSFADDARNVSQDEATEVVTVIGSQVDLGDAYQGGQVARTGRAGMFGAQDLMDTPFSSTNYTQELIENQQAASIGDVLQNDPTVRVATGFGNFQELYMMRGFPVFSDDMTLNGVYGILPRQYVAAEMLERVEVLRGANSFLNGASPGGTAGGGIGGAINLVPKRAGSEPLTRVTVGTQTGGQAYGAMDFARRFGDNQENGLRINLVARDGEDGVDDQDTQLGVLTVGFDHQGENFRLSADVGYQDHHIDSPRASVTPGTEIPSAPDASRNYAQNWTYTDDKQLFGAVRGEYDLNDSTSIWLAGGARKGKEHNLLANPTADSDGNLTAYLFDNIREDTVFSADSGIRHQFETASVAHTVVFSGSLYQSRSKNAYVTSDSINQIPVGTLDNYSQIDKPSGINFGGNMDDPKETERTTYGSLALADQLSMLDDQVNVMLGARLQRIETKSFAYGTAELNDGGYYGVTEFTPSLGVVYQPNFDVSLYANYSQALIPGEVVGNTNFSSGHAVTNAKEVLDVQKSEQYEVGAKYETGEYGATLTLFQISKPSYMYIDNGDGTDTYGDNGEQRHRGLELTAFGQPIDNVTVVGGVTLIDSEMVKSTSSAEKGKNAIGVPDVQANLNLEWATPFVQGLTLEGRTVYTGSQYASSDNSMEIGSWTRFDLGARYAMQLSGHELNLRARVNNLTDKSYWASAGGYPGSNYLVQGAPRTVVISASYDF